MTMQTVKKPVNSHEISASTTTARNSTALKNANIHFYCSSAAYVKFGDSTVTATTTPGTGYDKYITAGVEVDLATGGATHIAVILGSGSATAYVHEWTHKAL